MRKIYLNSFITLIICALFISMLLVECTKENDPVKYPKGTFPDTVINIRGLNSVFDDYNTSARELTGELLLVFSSNRKSSGSQFDLEQGLITFVFDQINGTFDLFSRMNNDAFTDTLLKVANTPRNDLGPYRCYNSYDGYEYLLISSENSSGNLDLMYCKNIPQYGNLIPYVNGPYPVKLVNTEFDDAYFCFDLKQDSAYFISNPEGNFDIYLKSRPDGKDIGAWFDSDYAPSVKVDSINSSSDDKCPMLYGRMMVFASNRPGGFGGYDLYYSVFRNGNWNSPVNFGPKINSISDDYRPLIGFADNFTNFYMIFSSNREGSLGGFDLYFTGFEPPL
ncbi:MAG: PD40 domain-containing protein [Bacteroidales bacterium]|nr:PD40 domain-containing protein [Bacteroidales bacterium]